MADEGGIEDETQARNKRLAVNVMGTAWPSFIEPDSHHFQSGDGCIICQDSSAKLGPAVSWPTRPLIDKPRH